MRFLILILFFPHLSIAQFVDTLQLQAAISGVPETSGLLWHDGQLWSHNDSGHDPILYQIDPQTGETVRQVVLQGIANVDWEDLGQDDTHCYIGDFGNNASGNRQDLTIYKIPLKQLTDPDVDTISRSEIGAISFFYPQQTDLGARPSNQTDFDCEAMFVHEGQIHLFTKEWTREQTVHYTLPLDAATQIPATAVARYDVGGLVTAADISPDGKSVFLLAYEDVTEQDADKDQTYGLWIRNFEGQAFLSGDIQRIDYTGGYLGNGQIEGVVYKNNQEIWISAEEVFIFAARLYLNTLPLSNALLPVDIVTDLHLYPNPAARSIHISHTSALTFPCVLQLVDSYGRVVLEKQVQRAADVYHIELPATPAHLKTHWLQIRHETGRLIARKALIIND